MMQGLHVGLLGLLEGWAQHRGCPPPYWSQDGSMGYVLNRLSTMAQYSRSASGFKRQFRFWMSGTS